MIVRILNDAQYRVDDALRETLNALDEQAGKAVESGSEEELKRLLTEMARHVREGGQRLDDADLSPSDAMIPPEDLTLDEARDLFSGEGLIPDLPVAS